MPLQALVPFRGTKVCALPAFAEAATRRQVCEPLCNIITLVNFFNFVHIVIMVYFKNGKQAIYL